MGIAVRQDPINSYGVLIIDQTAKPLKGMRLPSRHISLRVDRVDQHADPGFSHGKSGSELPIKSLGEDPPCHSGGNPRAQRPAAKPGQLPSNSCWAQKELVVGCSARKKRLTSVARLRFVVGDLQSSNSKSVQWPSDHAGMTAEPDCRA